jgi:nucleotide-binding universal stress UspA family protein
MRRFTRILCPIDVADPSRHAIEHAIVIARWHGASVTAQHVYAPVSSPVVALALTASVQPPVFDGAESARRRYELAAAIPWPTSAGVDIDLALDIGAPAPAILGRAASSRADLIVIGAHRSDWSEYLQLGSVAAKVLRKAACAVLTVPPPGRLTSKLPFARLLCPVDFSAPSLAAIELALSLARDAGAELTVLHVLETPEDDAGLEAPSHGSLSDRAARLQHERDALADLSALVPDPAHELNGRRVRVAHGTPYREILDTASTDAIDLIVMGAQGRNALETLFGSTTNQIVRRAACPVLTLRH